MNGSDPESELPATTSPPGDVVLDAHVPVVPPEPEEPTLDDPLVGLVSGSSVAPSMAVDAPLPVPTPTAVPAVPPRGNFAAFANFAPAVPAVPVRPPRPPVIPQRLEDGHGWRTPGLVLRTSESSGSAYLDILHEGHEGRAQTVYLPVAELRKLIAVATAAHLDPGVLWKKLSAIPIERPLPSRALDEELRVILLAHCGRPRG